PGAAPSTKAPDRSNEQNNRPACLRMMSILSQRSIWSLFEPVNKPTKPVASASKSSTLDPRHGSIEMGGQSLAETPSSYAVGTAHTTATAILFRCAMNSFIKARFRAGPCDQSRRIHGYGIPVSHRWLGERSK